MVNPSDRAKTLKVLQISGQMVDRTAMEDRLDWDSYDLANRPDNLEAASPRLNQAIALRRENDHLAKSENLSADNPCQYTEEVRNELRPKHLPLISVITVAYNSAKTVQACLSSVFAYTRQPFEVIVVDNASKDATRAIIDQYGDRITTILNDNNMGFSAACNQGISVTQSEYVVLLNPDTIVTPGWLDRLFAHFAPGIGAVGPTSDYVAGLQKLELYLPKDSPKELDLATLLTLLDHNRGQSVETRLLIGFCIALSRQALNEVGLLDEDLFLGNDDLDISWRLRQCGYKLLVATDTFVHHEGQVSFKTEESSKTEALVQESTDHLYAKLSAYYGPGNVPSPRELWGITWFNPTRASFRSHTDDSRLSQAREEHKARYRRASPALTSIIILAFNQLEHTRRCLQSIEQHTPQPHELVLVDNGSTDGTPQYLHEYTRSRGNVQVIVNTENRGFAAGNNQGLSVASGNYLLLLNNDTVVTEGWLARMLSVFERYPEVGIVGPVSNNISGPQKVTGASYQSFEQMQRFARQWSADHMGQTTESLRVVGFCLLVKQEVVERIGGLYEEFGSGNFEDDDFCLRAASAGFKSRIAQDVFIHHTGSQTFRGAGIDYRQSLERNWEIFKKRWKLPQDMPYGSYTVNVNAIDSAQYYVPIPPSVEVGSPTTIASHTEDICERPDASPLVAPCEVTTPDTHDFISRTSGMTTIVILMGNQPHHDEECVASIKKHTCQPYEILFAIQPRSEKARHLAKALRKANKRYCSASFEDKHSILRAVNHAIEASSGEFIVILDGNVTVTEGWLSGMLDCLKSVPNAGIVGPLTNSAPAPQLVEATGCRTSSEWDAFAKAFRHRNLYRRAIAMKVAGFCMLFKGDLIDSIGLFDPSLENTSLWDVDFSLRAFLSGYRSVIAADVFVRNYADQTGERNPNIFSAKWNSSDPGSDTGKALIALKAMEYAQGFLGLDKTEEAVKAVMEGIKATPDDVRLYHYLAGLLLDAKAPGEALAALQSIPETSRHSTETLELLSYASAALEQDDEADKLAEVLLSTNGCNATALNVKGLLAFKKGEMDRAITCLKNSMESDPGYAEPYRNLGLIQWSLDEKTKAFDLLEKAFILAPESENNATTYYTSVMEMEAWARSEQVLLDAKALYPSNRRIAFLLIDVLLKQGRLESAMSRIEEALTTFCIDDGLLSAALEVREKLGPLRVATDSGAGTLSVCMITKDEEVNMARCLCSLKPIADEIIIVDTGSADRTRDIARAFGAQVFDYVWGDDFSAARNASLEKANGDWILVHDADEVISPLDYEELRAITRRKPLKPVGYSLVTRNYTTSITLEGWTANLGDYPEETCAGWFPSGKVRIFVNDARFRFRNPVHELLEPALRENGVEIKVCKIPIHHYGRLNEVKTSAKAEVYYELGKTKLQIAGDDPSALRELAVQASELGKDDEAIDLWHRYIGLDPNLSRAHYSLSHCQLKNDDFENALTSAMRAFELDPNSKDAALQYATALLFCEESRDAIPLIEDVLKRVPNHLHAQITLAVALILDGQEQSKGVSLLTEMKKMNCDCSQLICTLAEKLKAAGKSDRVARVLSSAMEAGYSHPDWPELLEECQNNTIQLTA